MADVDPQAADAHTNALESQDATTVQVGIATAPLAASVDDTSANAVADAADSQPPLSKHKRKILFLDGLRGLAAILVVLAHAGYMKDRSLGPPAVDIFFVLSAFLLTLIFDTKARELFRQKASYRSWYLAMGDYFVRRFLRVYPLFAIVATVLALLPAEERTRTLQLKRSVEFKLLDVLSFQQHPHILWTLPIEISYYFMVPVFVVVELKMGRLLGVPAYALVFYNGLYQWELRKAHNSPWPHYPTFLCGSLAATVYSRINLLITRRKFVFKPWLTAVVQTMELLVVLLLLSQMFNHLLFDWIAKNPLPDSNHFVSFPLTVLIVCAMLHRGFFASVLEWSLLRYAGKVSYSMYLLHVFIVYQPFVVDQKSYYDRYFLTWILVFLLSTVSYYTVEWPCQRFAARFSAWIKQQDLALNGSAADLKYTVTLATRKASLASVP